MKVECLQEYDDEMLRFAVIIAKYQNQWVLCKHKKRNTYEFAGGHRELGEKIEETARRELYEETGAIDYTLSKISAYYVERECSKSYGMLYYAEIKSFTELPDYEMEKIQLFHDLPTNWTYPDIQPYLFEYLNEFLYKNQ